jgi:hypothetical protein
MGGSGHRKAGAMDYAMVAAAPVLRMGYVVNARRIADRRMILTGYRLADLLNVGCREFIRVQLLPT